MKSGDSVVIYRPLPVGGNTPALALTKSQQTVLRQVQRRNQDHPWLWALHKNWILMLAPL